MGVQFGIDKKRLHLAAQNPVRTLFYRALLVLVIIGVAWLMLWLARSGLKDNSGMPLGGLDVLYFTVVTVTTLGYGDIVPVSPEARAIIAFGITPLRLLVWVTLLSTAYDLVLRRSIENFEMERLKNSLSKHYVICGFGVKGRSAAKELIDRGVPGDQIVAIDQSSDALEKATRIGVHFLHGNASSEDSLRDAAIEKAAHAIIVPNNDEACVLICLTIRELAPNVKIRAAAREDENIKLISRSGANTVIAPSVSAGRMLASATSSPLSTTVIEELLEHNRGVDLNDIKVTGEQVGKRISELIEFDNYLVLGVKAASGETIGFKSARERVLQTGDIVVAYSEHPADVDGA